MSYIVRLHIFQLFFTAKYQIKAMACPMVAIAKRTTISGAVIISAPFRPWRRRQETEVRHVLLAAHQSTRYALVSRFRSSQALAAPSHANFGIKGTLATP